MTSDNSQCTCSTDAGGALDAPAPGDDRPAVEILPAIAPPPVLRHHVCSSDVDEIRAIFARAYPRSSCTPQPRESFGLRFDITGIGPIRLVTMEWNGAARTEASGDESLFALMFADSKGVEISARGSPFQVVPGRKAMVYSASDTAISQVQAGFQGCTIDLERAAVEAHFAALTGRALRRPLVFDRALSLEGGAGATLLSLTNLYRAEAQRAHPNVLLLASLRDAILTAMITGLRHSEATSLQAPAARVAPACVRRAEAFMAAHAAEPITLADVAAATGTPARSLQAAFRSARDMTPMEFLRRRRMELAREQLLAAAPGTTIVQVLRGLGFHHPGRFSAEYRKLFGESPSATLARRPHIDPA